MLNPVLPTLSRSRSRWLELAPHQAARRAPHEWRNRLGSGRRLTSPAYTHRFQCDTVCQRPSVHVCQIDNKRQRTAVYPKPQLLSNLLDCWCQRSESCCMTQALPGIAAPLAAPPATCLYASSAFGSNEAAARASAAIAPAMPLLRSACHEEGRKKRERTGTSTMTVLGAKHRRLAGQGSNNCTTPAISDGASSWILRRARHTARAIINSSSEQGLHFAEVCMSYPSHLLRNDCQSSGHDSRSASMIQNYHFRSHERILLNLHAGG